MATKERSAGMARSTNGFRAIVRAQPAAWQAQASWALAGQDVLAIILPGNLAPLMLPWQFNICCLLFAIRRH